MKKLFIIMIFGILLTGCYNGKQNNTYAETVESSSSYAEITDPTQTEWISENTEIPAETLDERVDHTDVTEQTNASEEEIGEADIIRDDEPMHTQPSNQETVTPTPEVSEEEPPATDTPSDSPSSPANSNVTDRDE